MERYQERYQGEFIPLNQLELFKEMETFIGATELTETIFRSDHASNNLVLKGVLGKDKQRFLEQIHATITNPILANLRAVYKGGM
ncbi:MAG: hypothetical protein A3K10_14920 [Bacteroidetes bacterium RIFCSPLOWO2_12_FULL_31_6]|nr:MAG: hypothetical protein A3K10_14920 [Bacteroidetes bacterium RIFCSPLOWO2_12_FULL_31_6]